MHEHNEEIITALAEKSLAPDEAAIAAAEVEACAECRTDLELLRIALDATSQAPPVYLTAAESSRLHEALHRDLRLASPAPIAPRPRPAWGRVAGWAFGMAAVFLGAVLLLPMLGGGSDDDASDAVAGAPLEESVATTAEASEPLQAQIEEDLDGVSMLGGDATADDGAATDQPSAEAPTTAPSAGLGLSVVAEGSLDEELRAEIVAALRLDTDAYRSTDATARAANPRYADCVEATTAADYSDEFSPPAGSEAQLIGLLDDGVAQQLLVAYIPADLDETAVAAISPASCELVDALP